MYQGDYSRPRAHFASPGGILGSGQELEVPYEKHRKEEGARASGGSYDRPTWTAVIFQESVAGESGTAFRVNHPRLQNGPPSDLLYVNDQLQLRHPCQR